MTNKFRRDQLERILWTAAQASLSVVSVEAIEQVVDLSASQKTFAVMVLTPVFTYIKTLVAKRVGNPDTAALMKDA